MIDYDGNVSSIQIMRSKGSGGSYRSGNNAIKGSYYNTQWKDRNLTRNVETNLGHRHHLSY